MPWLIKYELGGRERERWSRDEPMEREHGGLMYHSAVSGDRYVLNPSVPWLIKECEELPPDVQKRAKQ